MGTPNSREYYKCETYKSKEFMKIFGSKLHGECDTSRVCTDFLHLLGFSNRNNSGHCACTEKAI
jgi:hypothetical protein